MMLGCLLARSYTASSGVGICLSPKRRYAVHYMRLNLALAYSDMQRNITQLQEVEDLLCFNVIRGVTRAVR